MDRPECVFEVWDSRSPDLSLQVPHMPPPRSPCVFSLKPAGVGGVLQGYPSLSVLPTWAPGIDRYSKTIGHREKQSPSGAAKQRVNEAGPAESEELGSSELQTRLSTLPVQLRAGFPPCQVGRTGHHRLLVGPPTALGAVLGPNAPWLCGPPTTFSKHFLCWMLFLSLVLSKRKKNPNSSGCHGSLQPHQTLAVPSGPLPRFLSERTCVPRSSAFRGPGHGERKPGVPGDCERGALRRGRGRL